MPRYYYEDFETGSVFDFGGERAISKSEIIAFAEHYDPQPFHLDEEAAKHTLLGGLSASGWHTCCLVMRMNYDHWIKDTASMGAPGIAELRWSKPVRPGDRLKVRRTILEKRVSRARPHMGLVSMRCDVSNQAGEVVLTQTHTQLIGVRNPAPPSDAGKTSATPPIDAQKDLPRKTAIGSARPFAGHLEDLEIGAYLEIGTETFTKDSIIAFASQYDPQPFHMDEQAAKNSHFGALAASGWQTASLWMRNIVLTRQTIHAELAADGLVGPEGGPSPGFTRLRWIKPVFVGDTLTYSTQLVEKRQTSKPGWGLIFNRNAAVNQNGEIVFEFNGSAFAKTRT